MPFDLSHLVGADLVWLLDLTFAGQVFYLSGDEESVTIDGETFAYRPGLVWGGTLDDQIDLLGDAPSSNQVNLTIHFQGLADVPQLVADGHDLAAARGKLWLWSRGSDRRLLLIDGQVTDPQYGGKEEPVTLGLEETFFDEVALFPPATARIARGTTWGFSPPDLELERYPWIFGHPGLGAVAATPGLWVDNDKLLIAGHPVTTDAGTLVKVHNITQGSTVSVAAVGEEDLLGRDITTASVAAMAVAEEEDEFWVEWSTLGGWAGGIATHDGKVCRGAGDVLRFMMEQSSVRWDRGRLAAIIHPLNLFKIDAAIVADPGSRISPLEWISTHLAPILPLSARQGPEGLYWSLFRYDATASDAVGEINIDRTDGARDGAVSYSSIDEVANEVRLSYGFSGPTNKPTRVYVLTGDDGTLDNDPAAASNVACRISRDRFGLRVLERSTEVVWDTATACLIAHWLAAAFALPSRTIAYTVDQRFGYLAPGDVVTLTDREIGASSLVCLIDSVQWTESASIGLVLRALDNPARDTF